MADAQSARKTSGLTRGKAVLIGVLAVVLVGVLYMQFGSCAVRSRPPTPVGYTPRRPASTAAAVPAATTVLAEEGRKQAQAATSLPLPLWSTRRDGNRRTCRTWSLTIRSPCRQRFRSRDWRMPMRRKRRG